MENKNRHEFSQKYNQKKEALLRSLQSTKVPQKSFSARPLLTSIVTISLIIATLAITAFATAEIIESRLFNLKHNEDNIVLVVGNNSETEPDADPEKDKAKIPPVYYILHRDYMPPITGTEPGVTTFDSKLGKERGGRVILDIIDPPNGVNFSAIYDNYVVTDSLEINGHEALLINLGETYDYCKQLLVAFENEDVIVSCIAGYKVSNEELIKLAEGLWLEETSDFKLSTSTYRDVSELNFVNFKPDFSRAPNLNNLTEIQLGEIVTSYDLRFDSLEIIPTDVQILDSIDGLDHSQIKWCSAFYEPDWDNISEYMDENGTFIEYPRTEIIRSSSKNEPDRFGETVMVKKKLVMVKMKIRNTTSETVERMLEPFRIYLGKEITKKYNYVFNRTPDKYVLPEYPVYFDGRNVFGETEMKNADTFFTRNFAPGEEIVCNFGFLIDEDMLDESYLMFGDSAACYMKLLAE